MLNFVFLCLHTYVGIFKTWMSSDNEGFAPIKKSSASMSVLITLNSWSVRNETNEECAKNFFIQTFDIGIFI